MRFQNLWLIFTVIHDACFFGAGLGRHLSQNRSEGVSRAGVLGAFPPYMMEVLSFVATERAAGG